jgi:hypothetical protein
VHCAAPDFRHDFGTDTSRFLGYGRCMATKKATPWGKAALVDEVFVRQQAPGPRAFCTYVQLLETDSGERLVRLAYATAENGFVRRGPVTMQIDDLSRLLDELSGHPELAAAFRLGGVRRARPSGRAPRRRASPG